MNLKTLLPINSLQSEEDKLDCIKPDPRIEKIKSLITHNEIENVKG